MRGKTDKLSADLLAVLVLLEARMGFELEITSGHRKPAYNITVGGVADSEHTHDPSDGADVLCIRSATRYKMVREALALGVRRLGIGKTFLHIGVSKRHPQDVMWHYYPDEPKKPERESKTV
jgi:hypothetical protein